MFVTSPRAGSSLELKRHPILFDPTNPAHRRDYAGFLMGMPWQQLYQVVPPSKTVPATVQRLLLEHFLAAEMGLVAAEFKAQHAALQLVSA